jgi:hypothetical protein
VKKATLAHLKNDHERLSGELKLLESGVRVVSRKSSAGLEDVSAKEAMDIRRRLTRLDEMIAAIQAGVL